jgi:hypothetical protein
MTTTENRRTVRLSTARCRDRGKTRAVVVTLAGDWIELRLHGTRSTYKITASAAYLLAVHNHVLEEKTRKRAERDAKRKARR